MEDPGGQRPLSSLRTWLFFPDEIGQVLKMKVGSGGRGEGEVGGEGELSGESGVWAGKHPGFLPSREDAVAAVGQGAARPAPLRTAVIVT